MLTMTTKDEWWCDMMHPREEAEAFEPTPKVGESPEHRLSLTMDDMLNTCEESIHKKIIRLQLQTREEIYGPIGASRPKQYSGPNLVKPINKIFDKLEQHLLDELNKIKQARENIIESIK